MRRRTAKQMAIAQCEADLKTESILRGLRRFASLGWADMEADESRWTKQEWDDATAAEDWITERERFMREKEKR